MTRDEILRELQAIERVLDRRIVVVRVVLDASGKTLRTIYRGFFKGE